MDFYDAIYDTIHDYPGGSVAIAARMGIASSSLSNKVNPNLKNTYLHIKEFDQVIGMTNDHRSLEALANKYGYLLYKVPEVTQCTDMGVAEKLSKSLITLGNYGKEIHEALEDGRLEQREIKRIKHSMEKHFTTILKLFKRLEGMAEK